MKKLIYFVAVSQDGFVAREDGGLDDFAFDGEHVADLLADYPETFPTHLRSALQVSEEERCFDTVLMGRSTWEVGLESGVTSPYQHLEQWLFSTTLERTPDPDLRLVGENVVERVRALKAGDGLDIWLCGGPVLASSLVDEIDEVILKVNPFLMGAGKTLFARELSPARSLRLIDRRDYANGFSRVHLAMES